MYELFKKVLSAGFDVQDKIVESLDELVSKGKIDEKDREKFIEDLDKKLGETKDKGEEFINEVTKAITDKNPFMLKGNVESLEKKIQQLEKKISKLEGKKTATKKAEPKESSQTGEASSK